jgi:hypothetical protein
MAGIAFHDGRNRLYDHRLALNNPFHNKELRWKTKKMPANLPLR